VFDTNVTSDQRHSQAGNGCGPVCGLPWAGGAASGSPRHARAAGRDEPGAGRERRLGVAEDRGGIGLGRSQRLGDVPALKAGDVAKARSSDNYVAVEKGMIEIEQAPMPDKPDVGNVSALVNEVMAKYNASLAEVMKQARSKK
jgi:hypothetical protein